MAYQHTGLGVEAVIEWNQQQRFFSAAWTMNGQRHTKTRMNAIDMQDAKAKIKAWYPDQRVSHITLQLIAA